MRRFAIVVAVFGTGATMLLTLVAGCDSRSAGDARGAIGDPLSETQPSLLTKAPAPVELLRKPAGDEEKWATVKGKVIWAEDKVPQPVALNLGPAAAVPPCVPPTGLFSEEFAIDPKTKGVKNVVVWLAAAEAPKKKGDKWAAIPVHPALAKSVVPVVTLDQPCCTFEPHVLAIRDDQTLRVKNSAPFAHNINLKGGNNYGLNKVIQPGAVLNENIPAAAGLVNVECNMHPWMKAYIRVFDHPYFALTGADGTFEIKNAPGGDYRILVWHEGMGWVAFDNPEKRKEGKLIKIKGGETNDLGEFKVSKED